MNGVVYETARQDLLTRGMRRFHVSGRPSQPGDPSVTLSMEWEVGGRGELNSFEQIAPGDPTGYLGVEYGQNTDTRWQDTVTLGPLITTVDLSGTSGAGQNINCWCTSGTLNAGTEFLYFGRGNHLAKVNPSTMARVTEASANLAANVTDLLYTRAAGGTEEVSIGLGDATAYRTVTTCANAGSNDVTAANSSTQKGTKLLSSGLGADNRIFIAQGTTTTTPARMYGNILTGAVTMASPNWVQVASIAGDNVAITSLGLDSNFVCIGTNGGLYSVDPDYSKFRPIDPETERAATNCAAVGTAAWLGFIYNLKHALRFIKNGQGQSIGPESFAANRSPVYGRTTAIQTTDRWLYTCHSNGTDTYLLAGRKRRTGDLHDNPVTWFTLAKFAGKVSQTLGYLADAEIGSRTLPTLFGGYGDGSTTFDFFYAGLGRTDFWPDDTSYSYAASGTVLLTESRRYPGFIKDVEAVEFTTAGTLGAAKTVTIGMAVDGAAAVTLTAVAATGFQRQLPVTAGVPTAGWSGYRLKPQIAFATDSATAAPRVEGKLVVYFRARPRITKTYETWVVLPQQDVSGKSAREKVEQLLTEWGSGPIAFEDPDGKTGYLRVDAVDADEVIDSGNNKGIGASIVKLAHIKATVWPTVSGA